MEKECLDEDIQSMTDEKEHFLRDISH